MVERTFSCSEADLYAICRLGWQSCEQHLPAFNDFKAKYKAGLIADRRDEITAAENLPGEQARNEISESLRIELTQLATKCCKFWQKLKRYIADAWAPEFQKPKTEAAGQSFYLRASDFEWDSCQQLVVYGSKFIQNNVGTLTSGDNMPSTFEADFNNAKSDFETKHQAFLDSIEAAKIATNEKNTANNLIHANVMSMFKDGQELFQDNDAILKQFVFEQVLAVVSGPGTAGFRGTATDSVTGLPIEGVVISLKGSEKNTTSDEDGKFSIIQLAAQDWLVSATKPGYQDKHFTQKVKVGTVSNADIELVPNP